MKFGGALVDGTTVLRLKKNGFIDGSPEKQNQSGEFRRSGEAMHAGKINPAPRCRGIWGQGLHNLGGMYLAVRPYLAV